VRDLRSVKGEGEKRERWRLAAWGKGQLPWDLETQSSISWGGARAKGGANPSVRKNKRGGVRSKKRGGKTSTRIKEGGKDLKLVLGASESQAHATSRPRGTRRGRGRSLLGEEDQFRQKESWNQLRQVDLKKKPWRTIWREVLSAMRP